MSRGKFSSGEGKVSQGAGGLARDQLFAGVEGFEEMVRFQRVRRVRRSDTGKRVTGKGGSVTGCNGFQLCV